MNKRDAKRVEKIEEIKQIIEEMIDLVEIEYDGRWGNIDMYYPEENKRKYLLYFDGYEILVGSIDEVLDTPFIAGKNLKDVVRDIVIYNGQEQIYKY